jgi:hypothetical protein
VIFGDRTTSDGMEVGSRGAQVCNYATWHSEENKRKSISARPPDHGHCAPLGMGESYPGGGWVPPGKAKIVQLSAGRT